MEEPTLQRWERACHAAAIPFSAWTDVRSRANAKYQDENVSDYEMGHFLDTLRTEAPHLWRGAGDTAGQAPPLSPEEARVLVKGLTPTQQLTLGHTLTPKKTPGLPRRRA